MTFKHPKLENSPDFPYVVSEPPEVDKFGYYQLCWGPTPQQVVDYIATHKLVEYPLEISVGIMMMATKGKCNPQLVLESLRNN